MTTISPNSMIVRIAMIPPERKHPGGKQRPRRQPQLENELGAAAHYSVAATNRQVAAIFQRRPDYILLDDNLELNKDMLLEFFRAGILILRRLPDATSRRARRDPDSQIESAFADEIRALAVAGVAGFSTWEISVGVLRFGVLSGPQRKGGGR